MSQEAKFRLSVFGTILLVVAVGGLTFWNPLGPEPSARALISLEPIILPQFVTVNPPSSGSWVKVQTTPSSFEMTPNATADGDTIIRIRNVTTSDVSAFQNHHTVKTVTHAVIAKQGDLLEMTAWNGSEFSTADLGFVPAASDDAPPDLHENELTGIWNPSTNTFTFSGLVGCILDNSFPVVVQLDGPTSATSLTIAGTGTESSVPIPATSIYASAGDRIRITFQDNFGNQNELLYVAEVTSPAQSSPGNHAPSLNQVASENAGTAGMIPVGDGSSAVTAYGRDFSLSCSSCGSRKRLFAQTREMHGRETIALAGFDRRRLPGGLRRNPIDSGKRLRIC